jgi:hypothetical protein
MLNARNQSILDKTVDTDEPVIVFRAQDRLAPAAIAYYRTLASEAGCNPEFMGLLDEVQDAFMVWQADNVERLKTPD